MDNLDFQLPKKEEAVTLFARKNLPEDVFLSFNWSRLKTIRHADSIISWVAYSKERNQHSISTIQITAAKGHPIELIHHKIDSFKAIIEGQGKANYDKQYFLSGKNVHTTLELGKNKAEENSKGGRNVNKLSLVSECQCCPSTLPCVIVYGKKKRAVWVNTTVYGPSDSYPEVVYVPIGDLDAGGSGGGNGEVGGGTPPDSSALETINLQDFADYAILNSIYLLTTEFYPGKEMNYPWRWWETVQDQSWENLEAAFFNIDNLRLAYNIGTWLTINKELSIQSKQFLEEKELDTESLVAAKTLLEVVRQNLLYQSIGTPQANILQANYNEFACCLLNPVNPAGYAANMAVRIAYLKQQHPTWSLWKCYLEAHWDMIHFGLDVLGLVPVGGEVFDAINGIIYTVQGDGVNASLSFAGMVPIAGWGATGAKWALKTIHLANGSRATLKWYKGANNVISFGKENSAQFRKILGLGKIAVDPRQAHHIIPWELVNDGTQKVIQLAAQSKFPFHVQDALNGIPLSTVQHSGSHPDYTKRVAAALKEISDTYGVNLTPEIAYNEILDLTNRIKNAILTNPNTPINQIIF